MTMKKPILLLFAIAVGCNCFAQRSTSPTTHKWMYAPQVNNVSHLFSGVKPALKGADTVYSDTITYWNNKNAQIDSAGFYLYSQVYQDEGYTFGTNIVNDMGYAELYDVNVPGDTTIQILGLLSAWHGIVQPGSAKYVTFKVWGQDNTLYLQNDSNYIQGFPGAAKYSQSMPITQLQVGNYTSPDTIPVITWFTSPVTHVTNSFFVGSEINYNWNTIAGDTITLDATPQGNAVGVGQHHPDLSLPGSTVYTPRNAIEVTSGTWQDCFYDYGYKVNLSIIPIIQYKHPLGIGITKNNLTFFGNYPNPATNYTNISFALKNAADVTITIMDMQGKSIGIIQRPSLNAGAHAVQVQTAGMAAGNYIYMVRTSDGDGMAGRLTVTR